MKSFHKRFQKGKVYNQIYDGNIKRMEVYIIKIQNIKKKDFIFYKK